MSWIQSFFTTPARQALGWTFLGVVGIAMATGGVWFLTDDGDGTNIADADDSTVTATATPSATATRTSTPSPTPSPSPSPAATDTPAPTATPRPVTNTNTSTGGNAVPEPTAAPEPTEPAAVAGGDYCPPRNSGGVPTLPSGRMAGAVNIGGSAAASGTVDVFIAFDGVLGSSAKNVDGGFRIDFYANIMTCANRVGAAISAYANGQYFPTGRSVGDGGLPLIPVTIDLP